MDELVLCSYGKELLYSCHFCHWASCLLLQTIFKFPCFGWHSAKCHSLVLSFRPARSLYLYRQLIQRYYYLCYNHSRATTLPSVISRLQSHALHESQLKCYSLLEPQHILDAPESYWSLKYLFNIKLKPNKESFWAFNHEPKMKNLRRYIELVV